MKRKKLVMAAAAVMMSAMILTGCGDKEEKPGSTESTEQTATNESADVKESTEKDMPKTAAADASKLLKMGDYTEYTYEKFNPEISDEEVSDTYKAQVAALVEQGVTRKAEDPTAKGKAVEDGNTINIDFKGYIDGEAFSGGEGNIDLTIGSGTFIPGFEEALIGKNIGEKCEIDVTFPDPYTRDESLSGKPAKFEISINSRLQDVKVTEGNAYKLYYGYDTLDEYLAKIREDLESDNTEANHLTEAKNNYYSQILKDSEFGDISAEAEIYSTNLYNGYSDAASMNGISMEQLVGFYGYSSLDDFKADLLKSAENKVKTDLVFTEIAKKENITMTDEQYRSFVSAFATSQGYTDVDQYINDREIHFGKGSLWTDVLVSYTQEQLFAKYAKQK